MIVPTTQDVGKTVFYQQSHMRHPEYGTISSLGDKIVRVLFLFETTPKSCNIQDLYWPPNFCARDGVNLPDQKFAYYEDL